VLRSRENGASSLHANTHLDHVSEPARVQGNHLILKQTEGIRATHEDPPTIVTGDFNCKPGTPPYRVFVEEASRIPSSRPETRTTNALTTFTRSRESVSRLPTQTNPWGIDWILVRDNAEIVTIRSHRILRDGDEEAGKYASDHYPILAKIDLAD